METGALREIVYVGMYTRYIVELDDGTPLAAVAQNRTGTSSEVHERRGQRVSVSWHTESEVPL
jgi:hypothetical protein